MNKKTLITKILEFIYKANEKYKKSDIGDVWVIIFITLMSSIGIFIMLLTIILVLCLRGIYEFDILKRLEAINEEENKKNNDQGFENIR